MPTNPSPADDFEDDFADTDPFLDDEPNHAETECRLGRTVPRRRNVGHEALPLNRDKSLPG